LTTEPREARAALLVFAVAAVLSLGASCVGWSHALSDFHEWIQAETGIRVQFILQGGPWLDYETPTLGPPWRFPHELPVYYLLVAGLAKATGLAIEPAGRAVSLAFFYAALATLFALLGELDIAPRHRLLMLATCLVSPLYLFWSRTLTVESTALFLSLAFLTLLARYLARGGWIDGLAAIALGGAAFAVKPPTLVAFAFLGGLFWLVLNRRRGYPVDARLVLGAMALILPVAIGWTWHAHTDAIKRANPLVWAAYSTDAMVRDWVVGPGDQRSWSLVWTILRERAWPEAVGHVAVVLAAGLGVALAGRRRRLFLLALAIPVLHTFVFMPLQLSHPYDQYATALFVPLAVGLAVVALLERGGARRSLAWGLLALAVVSSLAGWWTQMRPLQEQDAYRKPAWFVRLARTLADSTRPSDVILGFGMSADPQVPYYARRRALMWPDWASPDPQGDDVAGALVALSGHHVGALFACPSSVPHETLAVFLKQCGLPGSPSASLAAGPRGHCDVYLRPSP
jgi:hypothetical protein